MYQIIESSQKKDQPKFVFIQSVRIIHHHILVFSPASFLCKDFELV